MPSDEANADVYLLPASSAQQRLWFLDRLGLGSAYHISRALRLLGPLDVAAMSEAFAETVRRHEALRTHFALVDGEPMQVIDPEFEFTLPLVDLRAIDEEARGVEMQRLIHEVARAPFVLHEGPLLRAKLVRRSDEEYVLLFTLHHILADGWSMGVLTDELAANYNAHCQGQASPFPPLPIQYGDFAVWQRDRLGGDALESELSYWRHQLESAPNLQLATDHPRPLEPSFHGAVESVLLSPGLLEALNAVSRREGVTLFMTLLGAFQSLLSRYTGQDDIVVGTPIAGRDRPELEDLIGFFVNTLALRVDLSGDPGFREVLGRVREVVLESFAHQGLPFERLVEEIQPERDSGRSPLFQVMFSLQNLPPLTQEFSGLATNLEELEVTTTRFDLEMHLSEEPEGLSISLVYNTELFDAETMARLLGHYQTLLDGAVSNLDRPLSQLPILTAREQKQLLAGWNDTATDYPRDACLAELFGEQVRMRPDAVAVEDSAALPGTGSTSYAELDRRSNRLARSLVGRGVGAGSRVGICIDRSADLIVGILGILKAGGVYVPLDPAYPQERLRFMLEDAEASLLLTQAHHQASLAARSTEVLCIDADGGEIAAESDAPVALATSAESLAYVIYTSGSTGRPKGVAVSQRAVVRLVVGTDYVDLDPSDRIAQLSNSSFDAATFEIWGALLHGARLVIIPKDVLLAPRDLAATIRAREITTAFLTTALFNQIAREVPDAFAPMKQLMTGGEAADPTAWCGVFTSGPPHRLLNIYGPTENTTFSTAHLVESVPEAATSIPIGRPIANTRAFVLDRFSNLVPIGVAGELYLGGDGLAQCYLAEPRLTAEKFVPDPFAAPGCGEGGRLYRTGDRVRRLPDGSIEFLGRIDQQVKLRGFRIELGEIETTLSQHDQVGGVAAVLREDEAGDPRLVAYVVPSAGRGSRDGGFDREALRTYLSEKLPGYMVPAVIVPLASLPLGPTGKVDRLALPVPEISPIGGGEGAVMPRTPVETAVAAIWSDLLDVEPIGVHDNFFHLGGHSLLATQVVARLTNHFELEIPLGWIFNAPTVAELSERVASAMGLESELSISPIVAVPRTALSTDPAVRSSESGAVTEGVFAMPTSFAQRRLWFMDQLGAGAAYNIARAVRLSGSMNVPALRASFGELVRRHEVLRTRFALLDGEAAQLIDPELAFELPLVDLGSLSESEREAEVARLAERDAEREFILAAEPPLRATLVRLSEREHVLLLTLHHIAADGWSMEILTAELSALYGAYGRGGASPLEALPVQYADFAVWQRDWLRGDVLERQLSYWRRQLGGAPVLQLPTDRPRPAVQEFQGESRQWALARRTTDDLRALSQHEGATLFMTLLAAFQILLQRYSGQDDIVVGTPIANRSRVEIEGLIGFFANSLALRSDLSGDASFREILQRVREVALGAYAHQDAPFEKLVEELRPERDLSRSPLFQVMFALQSAPQSQLTLHGLQSSELQLERSRVTARLDLELYLSEGPEGVEGFLVHDSALFDEATAARLLAHYTTLLEGIVANPDESISRLPLLTGAELNQLRAWNDTGRFAPQSAGLHEQFAAQVARKPDATAIVCGDRRWSYHDLDGRANQIAHHLRALGVGRDVLVGLCLERTPDLIAAILGIHRAGGAYVPLDPRYPRDRVAFMIEDSAAPVIITQEKFLGRLPERGVHRLCLDRERHALEAQPGTALSAAASPQQLSHVIYTSGSTGRPKGVAIERSSVAALIRWASEAFDQRDLAGVLASTSVCFDLSVFELFAPLAVGGKIILVDDALALPEATARREVTLINTVPSAAAELVATGGIPESVRAICLAGEPLRRELVDQLYEKTAVENVYDLYGPSEDTTYSTRARRDPGGPETIGRPIANTQLHVLDPHGQPLPIGVPGELYIGGAGLARGYLNQPSSTAEKFVPSPFTRGASEPGERLYRTGDRARHLADGRVEFLGRIDHQIKLRGFRIELGEIEVVLGGHTAVREAVVLVQDQRLIAYVAPHAGRSASSTELRGMLNDRLPDYMVPAVFVTLDALPRTPSGKIDRGVLPDWDGGRPELGVEYVAPRTEAERAIAAIWKDALALSQVGTRDNFFDLGGHSLMLVGVHEKLSTAFATDLSIVDVFKYATIELLARHLSETDGDAGAAGERERVKEGMDRLRRLREANRDQRDR